MTKFPSAEKVAMNKPKNSNRRSVIATIFLVALSVYSLLPLYWLIVSATKDGSSLFSSFAFWFDNPRDFFTNLEQVFAYNDGIYLTWIRNSAIYALASGIGATIVSLFAGYALSKFEFFGRGLTLFLVFGAVLVPTTALAIPLYILLSQIGLVNTIWAFILPSMLNPLGIVLMKVYSDSAVPKELIEAARVDGASEWRILFTISSPLLVPGIVTVFLFTVVATWNNYFLPLIVLNNPNLYPLTVGLAAWNSQAGAGGGSQILFPLVITGALIAIIPMVALFLFLQRFWQSSLTLGAVK
jgi:multiple sugar transport system permease protein